MNKSTWIDAGPVRGLKRRPLTEIKAGKARIALIYKDGEFSAVSGECNHEKGPLGKGRMEGDYVVCPWHGWKYHRKTGHAMPPFEIARLPRNEVLLKNGHLFVKNSPMNKRV